MIKKYWQFSLFNKFSIAIILIVLVFGIINITIVKNSVYNSLDSEIDKRSVVISKAIVEQALPHILSNNRVELNSLINYIKGVDPSIYYIFILNDADDAIAHSFESLVPAELITANRIEQGKTQNTVLIQESGNDKNIIKDFAMHILDKRIGTVRLGILETQIKSTVTSTVNSLLIMILFFLLVGIIGAFLFSYIIAKPITVLSKQTDIINIENIQEGIEKIESVRNSYFFKFRKMLYTEDEIDILYEKFLLMLKRLEENHNELNKIQLSMIQSEKMASIGTLSAGVAHEINNPIAGLKNCLKRMSETPDNIAQNIRYLSLMSEALDKMENVIRQLLDFSRKDKVVFLPVDLRNCIENTLSLIRYKIEFLEIKVSFNYSEQKPEIFANKNQIEQLILNLVLNSIDSIEEKKKENELFTGKIVFSINKSNDTIILEIADNGVGISSADLKTIFDPFFSAKKIRQGTGLGLAVCHNIVVLHKSQISALNNTEGGLIIRIIFPIAHKI